MFMLTADNAINFFGTEAVIIVSNVFPETAQNVDSVRLLSFEMAKSRWSKLSDIHNRLENEPRWMIDPLLVVTF